MSRHDEHFSVAFTLPRLRDLLLRELKGAGIAHGLDICPPSDVSPEAYERLAIEVEERFRDVHVPSSRALAAQPPEESAERSSSRALAAQPPEESAEGSSSPALAAQPSEESAEGSSSPALAAQPPGESAEGSSSPALAAQPSEESAEGSSSPALAAQPPEESAERSQAARCFFLATAFLEACEYEKKCAVVGAEEYLVAMRHEDNEVFQRARVCREGLQSAIHALESAPFPRKDWEPWIADLREYLVLFQAIALPPDPHVYAAPLTRKKLFEECRDRIAFCLDNTGLPPEDLAPVFYADFEKDRDRLLVLFRGRRYEARKKQYIF
jgi:hypothetical protein